MRCTLCPHLCELKEGQTGFCRARINRDGHIVSKQYGELTGVALDPIEKKPLYHFYPGSMILSVGSYGCNLRCPFCQNYSIAYDSGRSVQVKVNPEDLVEEAEFLKDQGNIGIAFTYNEPMIGFEFMLDTFKLAKAKGLKTVIVTNGMINKDYLEMLLPYTDALNIDLKAFNDLTYKKIQGDLETVKQTIELSSRVAHVEVTSLIVPKFNDSLEEMKQEAQWLASIDPQIVLHITRYFPRFRYKESPTSISLINEMVKCAKAYLPHVYRGNC